MLASWSRFSQARRICERRNTRTEGWASGCRFAQPHSARSGGRFDRRRGSVTVRARRRAASWLRIVAFRSHRPVVRDGVRACVGTACRVAVRHAPLSVRRCGAGRILVAKRCGRLVRALASSWRVRGAALQGIASLRSAPGAFFFALRVASFVGYCGFLLRAPNPSLQRTTGLACGHPCGR